MKTTTVILTVLCGAKMRPAGMADVDNQTGLTNSVSGHFRSSGFWEVDGS